MTPQTAEKLPTWDLCDLYGGPEDPRLQEDLDGVLAEARRFQEEYQGRIASRRVTARLLREALDGYEALLRRERRPSAFASLHYSADTSDPLRGKLLQKVQEAESRIATHLVFFELEMGRIPEERFATLVDDPLLGEYRHYLVHLREEARHHLTEPEEKILTETANCRGRAFGRLFTEITAGMTFEVDGEELTQSEVLALMYDPLREKRRAASEALASRLQQDARVLTFVLNTLLHEKDVLDRLRGFEAPEAARHLSNELEPAVVDAVVEVCVRNYSLVADYYHLKRELLGLEELTHYDRYAPLEEEAAEIGFEEARAMVLEAFREFSPRLEELAEPFFSRRWIDAEVRPGKRGGAFCAAVTPDHHPYILLNYTFRPRDVMTMAHELGHGVHDRLAGGQNLLNYHPVLPMAETASTFGELLVFEKLQQRLRSDRERLALLAAKLEDTFATVFRQIAMFRFERELHRRRREEGELETEIINGMWQEFMQEMFGDSLILGEEHRWTWLYVPHIFQMPFYVYAYAFGELLVLSLYTRAREEGPGFVDRYLELLSAGGSKRPEELLAPLGIDIADPGFWQGGCDLVRRNVARARELAGREA